MRAGSVIGVAAGAALWVGSAQAAVVSHAWDFTTLPTYGYGYGDYQQAIVPAFDKALGTLNQVDLTVSVDVDLTLTWANASHPTFEVLGGWSSTGDLDAFARPVPEMAPYGIGTTNIGEFLIYQHPAGYAGSLNYSGHYVGVGGTGPILDPDDSIWVTSDHVVLGYQEKFYGLWDSGDFVDFNVAGSAVHRMTLTYIYTPSVPEPEAWSLILLGFGLAGAGIRRHRRVPQTSGAR